MRRVAVAAAFFVAAAFVLASPLLLWPFLPVPHDAYAEALGLARWSRVAAALPALAGVALVVDAARRRGPGLRRALPALTLAGALAGIVLVTPLVGGLAQDAMRERYARGGFLEPYPDVDLGQTAPDESFHAFTGSRDFASANGTLDAGPVPARRGDVWDVAVRADGEGWRGPGLPTFASDVPATCAPGPYIDERANLRNPLVVVWWHCVVAEAGEGDVHVTLPGPTEGPVTLIVNVLPSLDVAVGSGLARSGAVLALVVTAVGGAAWAYVARPPRA
ncbi:MAG: hypothetical protein QOE90_536 [Thermoplasmata archaeon]|jgi:hypothetical protein|nr:hypothetical protein [Thermoplasmata archaeon]